MNYRHVTSSLLLIFVACAQAPIRTNPKLCKSAESNVRQKLGPEFRRVLTARMLHDELHGSYGCAIAYQMMEEELMEEVEQRDSLPESHKVAFLSQEPAKPARFMEVKRTNAAKGPVTVRFESADVTGDGFLDLIIIERAKRENTLVDYQGIKILNGNPAFTSEIFESSLLEKTKDGMLLLSEWIIEGTDKAPVLCLQSSLRKKCFEYSDTALRLIPKAASTKVPTPESPPTEVTKPNKKDEGTKLQFNPNDLGD